MTYSQQRSTNYITRKIAEVTDFFFLVTNYLICELYLHTEYHGGSRIFLVTRLVLGPTDRREVICELANFNHTDYHGGHGRQKFANSLIRDKEYNSG